MVRVELAYLYEPSHWAKMYAHGMVEGREGEEGLDEKEGSSVIRCYPSKQAMLACLSTLQRSA